MTAPEALAAGTDTPTLREVAGLSRTADPRDIRDAFEQTLPEMGIALPDHSPARRYALRRLAMKFAAGKTALTEPASDHWRETEVLGLLSSRHQLEGDNVVEEPLTP